MGRAQSAVQEHRKAVKVRPIERMHAGKIVAPYKVMESLIEEEEDHAPLKLATILMCWHNGWQADVDGVLVLAKMKKASDLDRAIGSRFGDSYDFVMQLNEKAWSSLSDDDKRMVIDHELTHAAADLDRDGEQKVDTRDRLCWRLRRHEIQEFRSIVDRYGVDKALNLNDRGIKASESMPLFPEGGNGEAIEGISIEKLLGIGGVTEAQVRKLQEAGFDSVEKLAKHMDASGTWWTRDIKGIGPETGVAVADAVAAVRTAVAAE